MTPCEHREELVRYVDGELAEEDQERFLAHLETCASCNECLAEEQALSARIRAARPDASAPESLRLFVAEHLQKAKAASSKPSGSAQGQRAVSLAWWPSLAVAALMLLAAGLAWLWHTRQQQRDEAVVAAALRAHHELETNQAALGIQSSSPQAVSAWFSSRLSFPFHMANAGIAADSKALYTLDGGRVVTVHGTQAALVSFHLSSEQLSLLVVPAGMLTAKGGKVVTSSGIRLHGRDLGGVHVVTWHNRGLGYVLSAESPMTNPQKCTMCHQQSANERAAMSALRAAP